MVDYSWNVIIFQIIFPSMGVTLLMVLCATVLACLLGFCLAIALFWVGKHGLSPNEKCYATLNIVVSFIRSFPFIILAISILPITRFITGSVIGWESALFPLTVAATPFMGRIFENCFKEVSLDLIDAARSFGATNLQIVFKILIPATLPSIVNGGVLSVIQILSLTTIAGTLGAGGIGASALIYGYQSFNDKIMYTLVIVLFVLVLAIQLLGDYVYKRIK
jgi:D-methionine transport system permease protein